VHRHAGLLLLLAVVVAVLAGCGGTATPDGGASASPGLSATPSPTDTASPSATPEPSTSATGAPPAASAEAVTGGPRRPADAAGPFPVVSVTDGDTLRIDRNGTEDTLRLIGLDTPETKDPRKPVQCFGREASARASQLLSGQRVWISTDPTQGTTDKYGRSLAYVWLPDGRLYNWVMVAEGYAHEYTYDLPYRYQDEFKAAERAADSGNRGLWAPTTCAGDTTQAAADAPGDAGQGGSGSGDTPATGNGSAGSGVDSSGGRATPNADGSCPAAFPIKGNEGSMKYHLPTGEYYNRTKAEDCFATTKDAEAAGYTASAV
jgi:micrococcal nuclease